MIAADSASVRPVTPTFIPQTDRSLSPCTQPIPADSSNAVLSVIERQSHLGNRIPETPLTQHITVKTHSERLAGENSLVD